MAAVSSRGIVELRALLARFAQLYRGRVFVLSAPQAYPEADRLFGKVSYLFVFANRATFGWAALLRPTGHFFDQKAPS
jgi:hypothetical protein